MTHPGGLPDDRAQVLDSADRYARERLAPLAERMDAEEWWPDDAFRALGKEGFLGVTAPAARGGSVFAAHPLRRRGGDEVELRGNAAAGRRWRRRVIRERGEPRTTSRPREVLTAAAGHFRSRGRPARSRPCGVNTTCVVPSRQRCSRR